jgi:sarcosine oxidase subunit alpha
VKAALDWAMPAGFYYRTMHKPARIWPVALKQVRKAAGLGKISANFQMPGTYDEIYPKADVCIIGGGPAGMSAALAAAEHELRVILLESRPWLGGFFDYRKAQNDAGIPLSQSARQMADRLEQNTNVRVFTQTAAVGVYNNNLVTAFQKGLDSDNFDERYLEIRATSVVAATGCIERPLLFENNERPGVMQISCAHRLARTYGLLPGKQAVFSIGHDLGLEAALDLFDLGLEVLCVADIREDGQDPALLEGLAERDIPFLRGWVATRAHGKKILNKVSLATIPGTLQKEFTCDLLVASAGMTPLTGPLSLAQTKLAYDPHTGFFLPQKRPAKVQVAGRLLGLNHPSSIEASGRLAGILAVADCGASVESQLKDARKNPNRPYPWALMPPNSSSALPPPVPGPVRGASPGTIFRCLLRNITAIQMRRPCRPPCAYPWFPPLSPPMPEPTTICASVRRSTIPKKPPAESSDALASGNGHAIFQVTIAAVRKSKMFVRMWACSMRPPWANSGSGGPMP